MASDNPSEPQPQRYWSVDPAEPVLIRMMGKEGLAAEEPVTINDCFLRTAEEFPDHPALVYEDVATKQWITITYS